MRISRDSDSDPCPVSDDMLGSLYRASKHGLPELIATVTPDVRAALALYCYRRGHLKSIGLAIASTCDIYDLETAGGVPIQLEVSDTISFQGATGDGGERQITVAVTSITVLGADGTPLSGFTYSTESGNAFNVIGGSRQRVQSATGG